MSSLTGIMTTGVLGMNAQSTALSSVSANIANVNTTGFKEVDTRFETLVGQPADARTPELQAQQFWQGVNTVQQQQVDRQGLITSAQDPSNFAISGRGFFAVASGVDATTGAVAANAQRMVTRAGDFQVDKNGFFKNAAGDYLLGIPVNADGTGTLAGTGGNQTLNTLQPVTLATNTTDAGVPTSLVKVFANLPATDTPTSTPQNDSVTVYDSQGNGYTMDLAFQKTGDDAWSMSVQSVTPQDPTNNPTTVSVSPTPVAVTFDQDGNVTSPAGDVSVGTFALSSGATLNFNLSLAGGGTSGGSVTQLDSQFADEGTKQDGASPGFSTGFNIDDNGILSQTFSNGLTVARYQVPLVTYVNPNGLEQQDGTNFIPTQDSGPETIVTPNQGGGGSITNNQVESSNVDLTDQFTDLIVTQRAFSASSKIITTADQMWQTVTQMYR